MEAAHFVTGHNPQRICAYPVLNQFGAAAQIISARRQINEIPHFLEPLHERPDRTESHTRCLGNFPVRPV